MILVDIYKINKCISTCFIGFKGVSLYIYIIMLSTKLLFILLLLSLSSSTVHSITCTITTEDNSLQLSNTCEIPSKTANTKKNPSANWEIHVDDSKYLQTIRGFGAAWTDATVNVFDTLSSTNASNLMKDLFDPTNQNGIKLILA